MESLERYSSESMSVHSVYQFTIKSVDYVGAREKKFQVEILRYDTLLKDCCYKDND